MIELNLENYTYQLPDERIARFPIEPRDASKLLVYQDGEIETETFKHLASKLPKKSFLVFNNTKVIPARLFFQKASGAVIEIFLLNPVAPSNIISQAMETHDCVWACMIGNKKRWKNEILTATLWIENEEISLAAELIDREKNWVRLVSSEHKSFAEVVRAFGKIPLPPYLGREVEEKDIESYQTVYSENDGAVAAPTAGLHFTDDVLQDLKKHGFSYNFLTLHVGAGTFQPIKVKEISTHTMHSEQVVFSRNFIENLLENLECVVPVGTTSMRSLESLYWYGVKLIKNYELRITSYEEYAPVFFIEKLFPYQFENQNLPTAKEALEGILLVMEETKQEELVGETEIFIFPGYEFKICKALITNFHQPDSTLVLLVAAFVGENWQKIYNYALENNYRFLSYGDSRS